MSKNVVTDPQPQHPWSGFGYGLLGVTIFSLTLPATRIAVSGLDPVFVGLGRGVVAAALSLILLVFTRQTIPPLRFLPNFCIVVGGVARIGQVQLLQPFLTILASSLFLGEHLLLTTLSFAAGVVVCVALAWMTG